MNKLTRPFYKPWYKRRLKKNEFHSSLDLSVDLILSLSNEERNEYFKDITRLRQIAHRVDMEEEDVVFDSTAQRWTNHDGVPTLPIEADLKD